MKQYLICNIDLNKIQSELLKLLIEFDRICRKYKLNYSIEGGTLLGAKKYGGFVPWDDDLDVVMLREDYEKFIKIARTELNEDFFLQNVDVEPTFPLMYSKLRLNDTKYVQANYEYMDIHHGLFLDIVPYDYADKKTYKMKIHKLGVLNGARNIKIGLCPPSIVERKKIRFFKKVIYRFLSTLPLKTLNLMMKRTLLKDSKRKSDYLYNFTNPLRSAPLISAKRFEEHTELTFCAHKFQAIKDYEIWLKEVFGDDYMITEPDKETRGPSHAISECVLSRKDKKKIGILTFHEADNYGAVLQAYALSHAINKLTIGTEYACEIIDYRNNPVYQRYRIKSIKEYKRITTKLKNLLLRKHLFQNNENFNVFRANFLPISVKKYNESNIYTANQDYAVFITGSDQVWNGLLTDNDDTYYLDFVGEGKRKIAYAASVGAEDYWFQGFEEKEKCVKRLNFISAREEKLQIGLEQRGYGSVQVLDPVFLLEKEEYRRITARSSLVKGEYILLYTIAVEKEVYQFAKKLARKTKKKLVYINPNQLIKSGMKNLRNVPVQHFIRLIQDASYVITSSFHGLAFSAIFNKEVFYSLSKSANNFNSRVETLAKILGISNRNILNEETLSEISINWEIANKNISNLRLSSLKFLEDSIFAGELND